MSLKERIYSVLVVSASEKLNTSLLAFLPESRFQPVRVVSSVNAAERAWSERSYDFVIINSPLRDDPGVRFAIDASHASDASILLLVRAEFHGETHALVTQHGIFTLSKPLSHLGVELALDWMASARERMRSLEKKTLSVEEKMEEIRVVNRAKWLLITELKMEEPQAHRYIEKQAMNRCISKREVAEEIIKTYA